MTLFIIVTGLGFYCFSQTETSPIDSSASVVSFSVSHLGFLTVKGKFKVFSGIVIEDVNGRLKAIESSIEVYSIDTGDKARDRTLKSDTYLDAEKYPLISFQSTSIDNNSITGRLKIKNISRKIQLPYVINSTHKKSFYTISAQLKRSDFKLDFGSMNALIGNPIKIELIIYKK